MINNYILVPNQIRGLTSVFVSWLVLCLATMAGMLFSLMLTVQVFTIVSLASGCLVTAISSGHWGQQVWPAVRAQAQWAAAQGNVSNPAVTE